MKYHLFFLFVLITACSSGKSGLQENIVSPGFALRRAYYLNQSIQTLHGRAHISVESNEGAQSFDAEVFYKGPDSLVVKIEYLLGADAAILALLKNRYVFYNKVNDNFLSGNIGDPFVDAFFKLPIPLEEFADLLLAKFPLDSSMQKYKLSTLDDSYLFEQEKKGNKWFYNIDFAYGRVKRLEIYNPENELLLSQEFAKFGEIKDLTFPRQIILKRPNTGQYIGIYYSDVQINTPIPEDVFKVIIPSSTKQLDLGF